jgi:hypothetical protein
VGGQLLRKSIQLVVMIACLSTAGSGLCLGQSGAADQSAGVDRRTQGTLHCRVEAPSAWVSGRISWIGVCKGGYAAGLGALRQTIDGAEPEFFLGRVEQGKLVSGVLVGEQGYTAGQWQDGSAKAVGDGGEIGRNTVIAGFEDGAKAADAVSRAMSRKSDTKASRFYARLAKKLRSQMD